MSVSIAPGAKLFTRMPCGASSIAAAFVNMFIAALVIE
jgi:hypothetical protein